MFTEEKNGLKLLRFDNLRSLSGINCAVSTRQGGVGGAGLDLGSSLTERAAPAAENLALFCAATGVEYSKVAHMRQRHTANVAIVEAAGQCAENTDALITAVAGVPLLALSADCAMTVFYDAEHSVLAVVHSGWRGALLNVYASVLSVMRLRYGTAPQKVIAGIAPMISAANYPVKGDFLEKLSAFYPGPEHRRCLIVKEGVHFFSLRELLRQQLELLGVTKYEFMHLCTYDQKDMFFSYRREGAAAGRFGLLATLK